MGKSENAVVQLVRTLAFGWVLEGTNMWFSFERTAQAFSEV